MTDTAPQWGLPSAWLQTFDAERHRALAQVALSPARRTMSFDTSSAWLERFPAQADNAVLCLIHDLQLFSRSPGMDLTGCTAGGQQRQELELPTWMNVLVHRLLSLDFDPGTVHQTGRNPLNEAARIAMLVYIASFWRRAGVRPTFTRILVDKQHRLLSRFPWRTIQSLADPSFRQLFQWILGISALEACYSSKGGGEVAVDMTTGWFVSTLREVSTEFGERVEDTRQLVELMQRVMFVEQVFDQHLRFMSHHLAQDAAETC